MGAPNFYPHENGIFFIEETSPEEAYEQYKEMQLDLGEEIESFNDVYDSMIVWSNDIDMEQSEMFIEDLICSMPCGMKAVSLGNYEVEVMNKQGKTIAIIILQGGYHADTQVIVETNPEEILGDYMPETQTELYEQYSPHHQRLLKYIEKITTKINLVGQFSNGEAVYELAE